jgi:hypothetical protein
LWARWEDAAAGQRPAVGALLCLDLLVLLHQSLPRLFRRQKNEEKEGLKRNLGGVDLAIKSILWEQFETRFHPPA